MMIKKTLLVALFFLVHTVHATPTKQITQEAQVVLGELESTLGKHKEQNSDTIAHLETAIQKLQAMLTLQDNQDLENEKIIIELRAQLNSLESQSAHDISVLEEQLIASSTELELLEDEYSEFVDASFAYLQGFFTMLQMAKQEYNGMLGERNLFSSSLQQLADVINASA